jgi:hypothetical protein
MKLPLTYSSGINWTCMDGHYCADGDGMVVAAHDGLQYVVTDQGDPIAAFDVLADALACAAKQLADNYPEIYEEVTA